eukprot:7676886-Pyramimonas_sp.AAC.1
MVKRIRVAHGEDVMTVALVLWGGTFWGGNVLSNISKWEWWEGSGVDRQADVVVLNEGVWWEMADCGDKCGAACRHEAYIASLRTFAHFHTRNKHRLPRILWRETSPQNFDTPSGRFDPAKMRCVPRSMQQLECGDTYNALAAPALAQMGLEVVPTWLPSAQALVAGEQRPHRAVADCTHFCGGGVYQAWNEIMAAVLGHVAGDDQS